MTSVGEFLQDAAVVLQSPAVVAAVGGAIGVAGTWLAGRQARQQARDDRIANLARTEAVTYLSACDAIWRAHLKLGQAIFEMQADHQDRERPNRNRMDAFSEMAAGRLDAQRAADALRILVNAIDQAGDALLAAAEVNIDKGVPSEAQLDAYIAARSNFVRFMKSAVEG